MFRWAASFWQTAGPGIGGVDFSHGWLVPVVSCVAVWFRRRELAAAPKQQDLRGIPLITVLPAASLPWDQGTAHASGHAELCWTLLDTAIYDVWLGNGPLVDLSLCIPALCIALQFFWAETCHRSAVIDGESGGDHPQRTGYGLYTHRVPSWSRLQKVGMQDLMWRPPALAFDH